MQEKGEDVSALQKKLAAERSKLEQRCRELELRNERLLEQQEVLKTGLQAVRDSIGATIT